MISARMPAESRKILLVDDDDDFRKALKTLLEEAGYWVIEAQNGKLAQSLLMASKARKERIDLVISDIRMPEIDGIELAKFVKEQDLSPVILMSGFPELIDAKDVITNADRVFFKPFQHEGLLEAINECLADQNASPEDAEYCAISIEEFVSGPRTRWDCYIRLSDRKYVKIMHKGERIALDRIRGYQNKDVAFFYFRREDFQKYVGFNVELVKATTATGSAVPRARKIKFATNTAKLILKNLSAAGPDKEAIGQASEFIESTAQMLMDDKAAMDLLETISSHSEYLYTHSVGTSLYAVMLAHKLKWKSAPTMFKVATAGLLADIGLKDFDPSLFKKSKTGWTAGQDKLYQDHPATGAAVISKIRSIPSDIGQIILHHHENCEGTGYPAGLK
ncbi:MAG: response regulator, partial [Deltaproteobacteria bacterium]|nr:response regulator [Deltaproteobacteria bacterium]